jgi:hypothetical protein
VTGRLRRAWRRYPRRTWLIWALGAVALLGSQALFWDPGLVLLLVDPELLALIATSALALTSTRVAALLPTTRICDVVARSARPVATATSQAADLAAGREGAGQAVTRPARAIRETTRTGRPCRS